MEKLGADPMILLAGLRNEKEVLMAKKRSFQAEGSKHANDISSIDAELMDIQSEIDKIHKSHF